MTAALWILAGLILIVWFFHRQKRQTRITPPGSALTREPQRSLSLDPPRPQSAQPRRRVAPPTARWLAAGEVCRIQQIDIPGGMIYVGSTPRPQRYRTNREDAHVIDPNARIDVRNPDHAGQSMSYWPSYSEITPQARAGYLQWLATGRRDPGAGIGHVFLYFYGLEHRLFVDGAWNDAHAILQEIDALLAVYGAQASFRDYASRFVDAVRISAGDLPNEPPREFATRSYELPLALQLGLSRQLSQGRLPGDWLFAWYAAHPETQLRTPATRCFEEFRQLFLLRFARQYPRGLAVRIPAKKLKLSYRPASGTPQVALAKPGTDLPDPSALKAPLKVAAAIAVDCTTALDSYSRFIGRHPAKRNTLAASLLLPHDLRGEAMPILNAIRAKLDAMTPISVNETTIGTLLTELGFDVAPGKKPNTTDLNQLSISLESLGFGMEPDPRFGGKIGGATASVFLFRTQDGVPIDPTRPAYVAARMLTEIAAAAATIDAENVELGLERVEAEIDNLSELTADERLRLYAYLASFRRTTPNPRQVVNKLAALAEGQRERIARVTLGALLADRRIGPDEVAFAEKLYKALGLPALQLYSDIHAVTGDTIAVSHELPIVASADPSTGGLPITPRPVTARTAPRALPHPPGRPITLDPQRLVEGRRAADAVRAQLGGGDREDDVPQIATPLSVTAPAPHTAAVATNAQSSAPPIDATALAHKRRETDAVRVLLADVFADPDDEAMAASESTSADEDRAWPTALPPRFVGLDDDHAAVVDFMIARQGTIPRSELEAEMSRRGMFFGGALETINDWAFGRFDEPLIEEGDPCIVPKHLLSELLETSEAT